MIKPQRLERFSPLDTLSSDGLRLAAAAITERRLAPGDILFSKGEQDNLSFFLLDGVISLHSDATSRPLLINAGSDFALMPLSRLKPRRYTAIADTAAIVAAIDETLLDKLLANDRAGTYEVTEIAVEDPAWMFRLMNNPAYAKVPASNFAALFSHLQDINTNNGQVIVQQGEVSDYYYIIRQGRAQLWCSLGGDPPILIGMLLEGDAFGEESLITGEPMNATIVMMGDGLLMRLPRCDFDTLLKQALTDWMAA
ncbi:MAG: cyclic nucleotide-binding domain-containing protein [Gallionellaceae bacterium]|nr:cyclic nucleotide-binding domain-containing protein [Gallionellaceae bacterium]